MNGGIRRKLNGAEGARDFIRTNPSEDPAYQTLGQRLDEGLGEARRHAEEQAGKTAEARAATALFQRTRKQAQRGYLRMIVKAGEAAAKANPALASRFRMIPVKLSNRGFLTEARALLATAVEQAEAIAPFGATPQVVAEATALVDRAAQALEAAVHARNKRVLATAGLDEATADVMDVVIRLDAFHQHRFVDDPDRLTAWRSARNVLARRTRQESARPVPGGEGSEGEGKAA